MNVTVSKFKEVLFSVLPVVTMVMILNFTITPMENVLIFRFLIGAACVVVGLTIFLIGVDLGITPLGEMTSSSLVKSNKLWMVLVVGFVLGFFISVAEPDLMVLAGQVSSVTGGGTPDELLLITVSIGLSIMLTLGFLRIFFNLPLYKILLILYFIIFVLAIFASKEFLAIAFDASGSTTGILAVPFILALSVGISKLKKDTKASEKDSFGLVAIASTGAIISVLALDVFSKKNKFAGTLSGESENTKHILKPFIDSIPEYFIESFRAIGPLVVILIILQVLSFKMPKEDMLQMFVGFFFGLIGLLLFLVGVNTGFMDIGSSIGHNLALMDNKAYIIAIGFALGIVTILAEPAVYVLIHQIEDVTSGYVKKKAVLISLTIGVGIAVALSVVRILVPQVQLWNYLLPGYIICLTLMFFIPKLFIGIAFDAGGVATGPVTATFILAFIQGAANAFEGADLMIDGFGMIAMVALLPIITLEILGLIFAIKSKKKEVANG